MNAVQVDTNKKKNFIILRKSLQLFIGMCIQIQDEVNTVVQSLSEKLW